MTKRKPHPDNALIDELEQDGPTPRQGSRSGGEVNRDVGTRSELRNTVGTAGIERPKGRDNPEEDDRKGAKTYEKIRKGNQDR